MWLTMSRMEWLKAERTMVRRTWPHAQHGDELFFHLFIKEYYARHVHTYRHISDGK